MHEELYALAMSARSPNRGPTVRELTGRFFADILLVLVDHEEFKEVDRELLKEKVVIDTRAVWR